MGEYTFINKRYTRLSKIGEGGMGEVLKAFDSQLEREVAIKLILPEFARKPQFKSRFEREVKSLAKLQHPNIVPVYDYFSSPEASYYVMAFIKGETLDTIIKRGQVSPGLIDSVAGGILNALAFAHENEIIHRDVKPENIFLDSKGHAYLADFGLVHIEDQDVTKLTREGSFLGTPAYSSPEQIEGKKLTPASDIYSLGIVLFELLTGKPPFTGNMNSIISGHLTKQPPRINIDSTHPFLRALTPHVYKMIEKEPPARFKSCREILKALYGGERAEIKGDMAPHCAKCGEALEAGATFCGACGAPVSNARAIDEAADKIIQGVRETTTKLAGAVDGLQLDVKLKEMKERLRNIGSSGTGLIKELRQLPSLKKQRDETKGLLKQLNETKDEVSEELFRELHSNYKNKIESLEKLINELNTQGEKRKTEIGLNRKSFSENLSKSEKDINEITRLFEKAAIGQEEYSGKKESLEKQIRQIKTTLHSLAEENSEIDYYLTHEEEVSYQRKKTEEKISAIKESIAVYYKKPVYKIATAFLVAGVLFLTGTQVYRYISRTPGMVVADQLNLRMAHRGDAKIIKTMGRGEKVYVYKTYISDDTTEGVTKWATQLFSSGKAINLPEGKAVKILDERGGMYYVTCRFNDGTTMEGTISKTNIELMSGKKWVQIKTNDGEKGWAYAEYIYLENENNDGKPQDIKSEESVTAGKLIPKGVFASSELYSDMEKTKYTAQNTLDGDIGTVWTPEKKRNPYGIGEWIKFQFDNEVSIERVRIVNGYAHTHPTYGDLYFLNNRVTKVLLAFDDGEEVISLNDGVPGFQDIELKKSHKSKNVTITIKDVAHGSKWTDNCLGELEFYGGAGGGAIETSMWISTTGHVYFIKKNGNDMSVVKTGTTEEYQGTWDDDSTFAFDTNYDRISVKIRNGSTAVEKNREGSFEWIKIGYDETLLTRSRTGNRAASNKLRLEGLTYHKNGFYNEAIRLWRQAAALDSSWGINYFNIACAYALSGKKYDALAFIAKYLDIETSAEKFKPIFTDKDLSSLWGTPQLDAIIKAKQ